MSTIGYESWAVDMADVGAIYPFQGYELPMVIVGVVFWLGWQVIQSKRETAHFEEAMKIGDPAKIKDMLDRY
jgi:hypothetical protein